MHHFYEYVCVRSGNIQHVSMALCVFPFTAALFFHLVQRTDDDLLDMMGFVFARIELAPLFLLH